MQAKTILLGFSLICCSQFAVAQLCFPVKKVHAYAQPVSRGNASKEMAGKDSRQGVNHLVYLVSKSKEIKINNVWIDGELYAANLREVSSPVIQPTPISSGSGDNNGTKMLVPASKHKTLQLVFVPLSGSDPKISYPAKFGRAPLVLEIAYKKKKKFIAVQQLEQLEVMPLY